MYTFPSSFFRVLGYSVGVSVCLSSFCFVRMFLLTLSFFVLILSNTYSYHTGCVLLYLWHINRWFSIFLVLMAILVPSWLWLTLMYLEITLQFFTKSAACLCFLKLNTLSSSPFVGALKLAFWVEVNCWKCLHLVFVPPSTVGFSSFTIGLSWILRPTWRLVSRVLTLPFL